MTDLPAGPSPRQTQPMSPLVRPAVASDSAGIAAVHVDTWRRAYRGLISQAYLDALSVPERARTWEQLIGELQTDGSAILVSEVAGKVTGFVRTGPSRDHGADVHTGELRGLYVHPDQVERETIFPHKVEEGRTADGTGLGAPQEGEVPHAMNRGRKDENAVTWVSCVPSGAIVNSALCGPSSMRSTILLPSGE